MIIPIFSRVDSGKTMDTQTLRSSLEPCNCSHCGSRLGWVDTDHLESTLVLFCDECAAEETDQDEEE